MWNTASCEERNTYMLTVQHNLSKSLAETLKDIQVSLCPTANFAIKKPRTQKYFNDYDEEIKLKEGTKRILQVSPLTFHSIFGYEGGGAYHLKTGRIFLQEQGWCRACITHETLHSVSTFALNVDIAKRFAFLSEGITELFTAYVLKKRYPYCFDAWKYQKYPKWCDPPMDYWDMARIWFTFCKFVGLDVLKNFFFNLDNLEWEKKWEKFQNEINLKSKKKFSLELNSNHRLDESFYEECQRVFGYDEIEEFFETKSYLFDFNLI